MFSSDDDSVVEIASPTKLKGPNKARFEQVLQGGRVFRSPLFRVAWIEGSGLIGVATAKRIGCTPQRNRVKRRLKEAIRSHRSPVLSTVDSVWIASAMDVEPTMTELRNAVGSVIEKISGAWGGTSPRP